MSLLQCADDLTNTSNFSLIYVHNVRKFPKINTSQDSPDYEISDYSMKLLIVSYQNLSTVQPTITHCFIHYESCNCNTLKSQMSLHLFNRDELKQKDNHIPGL